MQCIQLLVLQVCTLKRICKFATCQQKTIRAALKIPMEASEHAMQITTSGRLDEFLGSTLRLGSPTLIPFNAQCNVHTRVQTNIYLRCAYAAFGSSAKRLVAAECKYSQTPDELSVQTKDIRRSEFHQSKTRTKRCSLSLFHCGEWRARSFVF